MLKYLIQPDVKDSVGLLRHKCCPTFRLYHPIKICLAACSTYRHILALYNDLTVFIEEGEISVRILQPPPFFKPAI